MKRVIHYVIPLLILIILVSVFAFLMSNGNMQLLFPQGYIAQHQSMLLFYALLIALGVGLPVIGLTLFTALHFREGNEQAQYAPNWTGSKMLRILWWSIPGIIVFFWAIIGWQYAHAFDPYKPIQASTQPLTIQVVALQWRWLFIYPQQHIATINTIAIPVNTPVSFHLTADAPMNSFWIPSLGGQIYAMTGMETQLHLMANTKGVFPGGAAEINGDGFSDMQFSVHALSHDDFMRWVDHTQQSSSILDHAAFDKLAKPSEDNTEKLYILSDQNLFTEVIMKYMPSSSMNM